jgi:hypothetical protein
MNEYARMKELEYSDPRNQFERDLLVQQINAVERKAMILENEVRKGDLSY